MKSRIVQWSVAIACLGAAATPAMGAEESAKALPTLLIKGEVVSLDTNDPSAVLLKVKDRYGFETPIYLAPQTKIAKGDQTLAAADLKPGTAVEVEYNFDINTAKRQAASVKLSPPATAATPSAAAPSTVPAAATPSAAVPAASPATAAASATAPAAAPQATTSSEPASTPAVSTTAPMVKEHPGKEHPGQATQ